MSKPNTYFQFKQFRIDQSHSGMKVTTEGCILGGWVASQNLRPKRILDIGTGTGLLALMLAQRFPDAQIDAVEVDLRAYEEATTNFDASIWSDRINSFHTSIQYFEFTERYDLIISNPPFFKNSLQTEHQHVNLARHDDFLSQQDLVHIIDEMLAPEGSAFILYPEREMNLFLHEANTQGLQNNRRLTIYNHDKSPVFRVIAEISKKSEDHSEKILRIRQLDNEYTPEFVRLLKPYYLHL